MAFQSAVESVQSVVSGLVKSRTDYEQTLGQMSEEERKQETTKRLAEYKAMCLGGITSVLWKDTNSLTKKLHGISPAVAGMASAFFIVALFAVLFGLAASTFSRSAPYAMAIAGNGGLWSVLFIIVTCHLEMLEFLPLALLVISGIFFSATFIVYWYFCSRDLKVFLVAMKCVLAVMYMVYCCFIAICRYVVAKVVYFFRRNASRQQIHTDDFALNEILIAEDKNSIEMMWRQENRHFLL